MTSSRTKEIPRYDDALHGGDVDEIQTGEYNYKYRLLNGIVMPPYVTPERYAISRAVRTRPGDVCYTSYPKSGSTWLANIIYLILNRGNTPDKVTLRSQLFWMESGWTYIRSPEEADAAPSPRIFKSHMPYPMSLGGGPADNPDCRFVYIARNPKDVAVSYYHFESRKAWSGDYDGPWEHWLEMFLAGRVQRGDWFDHVLGWWRHRELPNVLFITYEDLVLDFRGTLGKLLGFLDFDYPDEVISAICEKSAFDYMKRAEFTNHQQISEMEGFFRSGRIGSWKSQFSDAQSREFDRVYAQRMAGTGLDFVFES